MPRVAVYVIIRRLRDPYEPNKFVRVIIEVMLNGDRADWLRAKYERENPSRDYIVEQHGLNVDPPKT